MNMYPMTKGGAEALKAELDHLKSKARPEVITAIADARAHGDLKENAEYHAAREQQGFIEGRIKELEGKLSHAQVIDITAIKQDGKVVFGVTVHLEHLESGEAVQYQIVGEDEADIKANKISVGSPVARAMIGKFEGDLVTVQAPSGLIEYEIVKIYYK